MRADRMSVSSTEAIAAVKTMFWSSAPSSAM
jgi:hypothetical protein